MISAFSTGQGGGGREGRADFGGDWRAGSVPSGSEPVHGFAGPCGDHAGGEFVIECGMPTCCQQRVDSRQIVVSH